MFKKFISMVTGAILASTCLAVVAMPAANAAVYTIATTSTITSTQLNPTIVITSDASYISVMPTDYTVNYGSTGLYWFSSNIASGTITIGLRGTATCGGTITIQAKTSAFSPAATAASNTLSIVVSGGSCSNDATLSSSSTIKGVTVTSLGTPGTIPGDVPVRGSVTLTEAQAADTSNSGSFVTSFVRSESHATFQQKAKFASAAPSSSAGPNYTNAAISNGDFFSIYLRSQDGTSTKFYIIDVVVSSGGSSPAPTLTAAEIAANAAAAAKAAAEAAAAVRAAEIATAQTKLATVLKSDKPGTLTEFRSANINVTTDAALTRLNAEILKLAAADRSDFAKIKALADKIEFDESFFNATARPTVATYSQYGVTVTDRTVATINAKVLELPVAKRTDVTAIAEIAKVETFVDRVANPATRLSVPAATLVSKGLLPADSPYKYSVVQGLAMYPEGSLNTMAKIEAAIKAEVDKAGARKAKTEAIKAKIAARRR